MIGQKFIRLAGWVAITTVLVWVNGCGDEPVDDPCKALSETSADFTMEEAFGSGDTFLYACDTAIIRFVRFNAIDGAASSYEWRIGEGVYTTASIILRFDLTTETVIPITLIVNKEPNVKCFPNDNGMDTVTRNLVFVDPSETLVAGIYEGANTDTPTEKYTIEVEIRPTVSGGELELYVYEPALNCWISSEPNLGYRGVRVSDFTGGSEPCANGMYLAHVVILDKNNVDVTIERFFYDPPENYANRVKKIFKGVRKF